jgi:hypothetical protein
MDREVYMAAAQFALTMATNLLPILTFFIALDNAKRSALRAWERSTSPVASVGAQLRDDIIHIGASISELHFLLG